MTSQGFDWRNARVSDLYPSTDVVAEIGRVAIAAARVDHELALVLLALKFPAPFEELVKSSSSPLEKKLRTRIAEFFESETQELCDHILSVVRSSIYARNAVVHSVWTPEDRQGHFAPGALEGAGLDGSVSVRPCD